jgi:hypothetical protein
MLATATKADARCGTNFSRTLTGLKMPAVHCEMQWWCWIPISMRRVLTAFQGEKGMQE